jgi:hypothetical protein
MLDKIIDHIPINWGLIKNPYNWAVVTLMVAIGGITLGLIFHPANVADSVMRSATGDDT